MEAELKHEKQKVEMLQRDLVDSQKVSYSNRMLSRITGRYALASC